MLAYVFWHRPAADADTARYEQSLRELHDSLAAEPPFGLQTSVSLRAEELPWLPDGSPGYEDWYVVEDWAALGVLRESARLRAPHERLVQDSGRGTAGLYRLCEGHATPAWARAAVWVDVPPVAEAPAIALLLGDGVDSGTSALWRRELVLGPAPQYCLLTDGEAPGAQPDRLPEGWSARAFRRAAIR